MAFARNAQYHCCHPNKGFSNKKAGITAWNISGFTVLNYVVSTSTGIVNSRIPSVRSATKKDSGQITLA
jgi:hypothetical protein